MNNIIQISEAALIALHSLVIIAQDPVNSVNNKYIAEKINASENHVSKVLQRLVKAGFIYSNRGPSGGFRLAKSSGQITLLDIYETMDGKIQYKHCAMHGQTCPFTNCLFSGINEIVYKEVYQHFKNKTLNDFK
jgi:Rrf2 family transcriptional regulator, nitric oxide-sensitive transcriptional repressor